MSWDFKDNEAFNKSTTWNQAEAMQYRIHDLRLRISEARRNNDQYKLIIELRNLFLEISPQLLGEEKTSITEDLNTAGRYVTSRSTYLRNKAISYMVKAEMAMGDAMGARGMLLPKQQDPSKATLGSGF